LPSIERAASDERNFVKKGVSWALRAIRGRSGGLYTDSLGLARRLAESPELAARWVGNDALKDLTRPSVRARLLAREAKRGVALGKKKKKAPKRPVRAS
jgi:hypothetical protein